MLPQYSCNLATTLTSTDNTTNLDWNLHVTAGWEKRTPFHLHIHQATAAALSHQPNPSFPQFSELPVELQIRILELCTPGTLFNAGETSSTLRTEASKLFWSDPDTYYPVWSFWLLEGGYPGFAWWDTDFQRHVQNVEIEYIAGTDRFICSRADEKTIIHRERVTAFWETLRQRFPSAKKVVINLNSRRPSWWEDAEPVPLPLRVLIHACPPDIDVFALVLEERGQHVDIDIDATATKILSESATKWQRSLYRLRENNTWQRVKLQQPRNTVLMPPKQFNGPVGAFKQLEYRVSQLCLREAGLWPLMIAAVGQHHFRQVNDTLSCPSEGCNATLATFGEWIAHASSLHCREWIHFDIVPDSVRTLFEERKRLVAMEREEITRRYRETKEDWNTDDGAQRSEIERGWLAQLQSDERWYTSKMPRESRLWRRFVQQMDPDWEGFYDEDD